MPALPALVFAAALAGTSATATLPAPALPPSPPATAAPASPQPTTDLMAVPPELRHLVMQRVARRSQSAQERLEKLVQLMFAPDGLALRYDASETFDVADAYATGRVNCLSFTLLFVALAREIGLDARAQEVGKVLSWYEQGGLAYNYGHINVRVRLDGRVGTIDLDNNILMDRRGPRAVSDNRLFAHYYNNRGAELLAQGLLDGARAHFERALALDAAMPDTWNNLGVLEYRQGRYAAAQADYEHALSLDPEHGATLANALNLYRQLDDKVRVQAVLARLQHAQARDPFHQYLLGTEAERGGDYATAARDYARAIELYPNAHQFHFGLARVSFLAGDSARAERELRLANTLGPSSQRQRYQAKLEALHRLQAQGR